MTEEQLKELREVVELMEFYTAKNDIAHLVALDTRFHELIYEPAAAARFDIFWLRCTTTSAKRARAR